MKQTAGEALELSPDQVYEILGHEYRRHVLRVLHERPGPVDVEELAAVVAARSRDVPVSAVDETDRDAVLVELHHNHIPRLRGVRLVSYDAGESSSVKLVGDIQPLLPTLQSEGGEIREYHVD